MFFAEMEGGNFRLAFNVLKPGPWQDPMVRRAIALWIDKQPAIASALGGFGWTSPDLGPSQHSRSQALRQLAQVRPRHRSTRSKPRRSA